MKPSSKDHGTFGYFCSLLGRFPKARDPKRDMNACSDILFTVLKGHYVAYACKLLGINDVSEPSKLVGNLKDKNAKQAFLAKISYQVIHKLSLNEKALLGGIVNTTNDESYDYAAVFCHFASLALEFKNSWEEGDAWERTIRCWKLFLLHFRCSNSTKYCWEALRLQFQLIQLSPCLSHQVMWGRYVNVHGCPGGNIPCDLFNEHMNKLFKDIIEYMGANLTEKTVHRAARSVTILSKIVRNFDGQTVVPVQTRSHAEKDDNHDVTKVAEVLIKNKIIEIIPGRKL